MAGSINKVILVGNVGRDPEIRSMQNGSRVANFSLATGEYWLDKATNERKTLTQWHRVVVFNDNLVDVLEKYVRKGAKLYIEGSMQYRKYTDQNGVERNTSEVVLSRFKGELQMLDSRADRQGSSDDYDPNYGSNHAPEATSKTTEEHNIAADLDDDIPF